MNSPSNHDHGPLSEVIVRLERSNRRLRLALIVIAVGALSLVLMGQSAIYPAQTFGIYPPEGNTLWMWNTATGEARLFDNISQGTNPRLRATVHWDD